MTRGGSAAALALLAALVGIEQLRDRPPAPLADDAPPQVFAEGRARRIDRALAALGPHPLGSPAHDRARELLRGALADIPRLEVEVQEVDAARAYAHGRGAIVAHVHNLVARLPGLRPEAVLVTAHYDSAPLAPGAADDGAAAASLVEMLRALASGPPLPRTVIVAWTDAEELGLVGASGLVRHPWLRDARVFVNVDAAGVAGKALLYRTTPGAGALLDAYARVPRPFANVIGQDLMEHGLVPSDTDFHVLADAGLPGVDLAFFEDGWAYHTALDDDARLERGSLQHLGDDLCAFVRALAAGAPSQGSGGALYFDVLGLGLVHLRATRAAALGWLIVALAVILSLLRRRTLSGAARFAAAALLALLAALALPLALAALVGFVLRRPMGWFSSPVLGVLAYAPIAAAAACAVLAAARRRVPDDADEPAGVTLALALVLGAALLAHLGAAYLVAAWCAASAALLLTGGRGLVVLCALPLALTVQAVAMLVRLFVPLSGRLGLGATSELVMAAIIAVPVAQAALPLARRLSRRVVVSAAGAGLIALGIACVLPRATPARPRRVDVNRHLRDGATTLRVLAEDGSPVTDAVPPPVIATRPIVEARALGEDASGRRVELRVRGGRTVWVRLPAGAVRAWSLPLPAPDATFAVTLQIDGARLADVPRVQLTVPAKPLEIGIASEDECSAAERAALRAVIPAATIDCTVSSSEKTTL